MQGENPGKGKQLVCFVVMGFGKKIVKLLQPVIAAPDFDDRPDKVWVYATLANCQFALGNALEAQSAETQFKNLAKLGWMVEAYEDGKKAVLAARVGG